MTTESVRSSFPSRQLTKAEAVIQAKLVLLIVCALVTFTQRAFSQWGTANVDGIIESGEYGNTANGTNQIGTNTSQTWYMTWDATNLYVGITNANLSEAAIIYIGTGGSGTTTGENYDGTGFSSLPFPAQFVTYFKDGYNEYHTSNGGAWSSPTSNAETYASNASSGPNTRELAIPWSAVTGGGIPSSFNFFGYVTSSGGYVYGQVPNDNPGATIGTSATYTQYYGITNTGNATSTPPFSSEQPSGFSAADKAGFYHNTFDPFYRSSEGSVTENTQVTLRLRTLHSTGVYGVNLRTYQLDTASGNTTGPVDTNMPFDQNITIGSTEYDVWKITVTMPSSPTVYYYKFVINKASTVGFYSDDYVDDYDNLNKDGTGVASNAEPFQSFQITVYDPNFQTPPWMATANVYQIFPDRFRNGSPTNDYCVNGSSSGCPSFYGQPPSSDIAVTTWNTQLCDPYNSSGDCYNNFGSIFYGGDLLGIQNELDYIQGLGFDTIYLNPIFYGNSNHRYDTDDFLNIDPALGGNAAFASLVTAMNQRGMRVILDGTFEDASSDSTYFNEYNKFPDVGACQSLSSQWRTWFQFLDNNVPCATTDYSGWDGFNSLPLLVTSQTSVQQFFFSGTPDNVMLHWYNAGAGGWRFDSAPNIPNSYWHALRPYAKTDNANGPLIGEIWPNASQWLAGDQFDSTMNYRFRRNVTGFARGQYGWTDDNDNGNDSIIPLTPSQFDTANRAVRDDYPLPATFAMLNLIDSHDTNRALYVLTELGDNGLTQAKQRLELAALFQFTYIGAPTVFYGDEAAINAPSRYSGSNGPVGDPYTRAPYPWTDQPGDPSVYGPPDQNVIAFYNTLGHVRKQYPALSSGTFVTLLTGDTQQSGTAANTYAYARVGANQTAIVALNNGSTTNAPAIPVGAHFSDGTALHDMLSGNTYSVSGGNVSLTLNAISGAVLLPSPVTVDVTPPSGSISLTPMPNATGWLNVSPVDASISASDSGSGISQIFYWVDGGATSSTGSNPASTSISGEGQHTVSARATDNAGNASALISAAVNIDLTPPVVAVTGVANGAMYPYNQVPSAGCSTTDALSGVAMQATVAVSGGNGQNYGSYMATCSGAVDNAGNMASPVSASYTVLVPASYLLTTSVSPVAGGTVSPPSGTYQAGSVVPLAATPNSGYAFNRWTGNVANSTSANTTITMTGPQTAVANFSGLPAVNLSPNPADFGTVYLNRVHSKVVTLTNTGTAGLSISNISLTPTGGNSSAFQLTKTCGAMVAPGKACSITIGLSASTIGADTATLNVADNAAGSPQQVSVTATVINPRAALSPQSESFGTHKVGMRTVARNVTLTNNGTTTLDIDSIGIIGTDQSDFGESNNCASTLAPGHSCTISVTFDAQAKGARSAGLTVTDNAFVSSETIPLSGTGD